MTPQMQAVQLGLISLIMAVLALAEWRAGRLFPTEASRGDNRLDLAIMLAMPARRAASAMISAETPGLIRRRIESSTLSSSKIAARPL